MDDLLSSSKMTGFLDHLGSVPPCVACGSVVVKENKLKVTLTGEWKGHWVCENGHRNIFK